VQSSSRGAPVHDVSRRTACCLAFSRHVLPQARSNRDMGTERIEGVQGGRTVGATDAGLEDLSVAVRAGVGTLLAHIED